MHADHRTKIIATIGPASEKEETLRAMVRSGMNVCRINASHGTHASHKRIIGAIRRINRSLGTHVAVLYDLQGPKIRIGEAARNVTLRDGQEILLTSAEGVSDDRVIHIRYPSFEQDVDAGDTLLIDDGKIELVALKKSRRGPVTARVIHGGALSSNKGVNLPFTRISAPSLTKKDRADLRFAVRERVEWIGLSFVRKASDLEGLRSLINRAKGISRIVAKIEKPEALRNIDAIITAADAIMVARGDLGVEIEMEKVPVIQKMLVKKCNQACKPIIIATQMMESMTVHFRPTRAESNDVANAVFDGADALMLSGETSVGQFPVKVVEEMKKIIRICEEEPSIFNRHFAPVLDSPSFMSDSICYNACLMADQAGASALIAMTHSGYTAFRISSQRPAARIFIFTDHKPLVNVLSLVWGVRGFYYNKYKSTDNTIGEIRDILRRNKLINRGDIVINVASMPINERGTTGREPPAGRGTGCAGTAPPP